MSEMIRVNTRISKTLNDWLDEQTKETGLPKSSQIMLALEVYRQQQNAMKNMGDMSMIIEVLSDLQKEIKNMQP